MLQCASRDDSPKSKQVYLHFRRNNIQPAFELLALKSDVLTAASLLTAILTANICARNIKIWVPHLHPGGYDHFNYRLFQNLELFSALKFYDDGMSSVSDKTYLYQQGFLPYNRAVHTWDFIYTQNPQTTRSNVKAISKLDKLYQIAQNYPASISSLADFNDPLSLSKNFDPFFVHDRFSSKPPTEQTLPCIIIASKGLDYCNVIAATTKDDSFREIYYIPHYVSAKNDQRIYSFTTVISTKIVELSLFDLLKRTDFVVYFAVTSSILITF